MSQVFFLSYARPRPVAQDTEPLVRQFHADLQSKLANHVTSGPNPFGYFDRCDLEAGSANWVTSLNEALVQHPIGVVLLSPDYLDSTRPWCRWECLYMAQRNEALDRLKPALTHDAPKALIMLNWGNPSESGFPKDFPQQTQRLGESIALDDNDDIEAVKHVCSRGLRSVMELARADDPKATAMYVRFVQCLARYIAQQWVLWAKVVQRQFDIPLPPPFDGQGWTPAVASSSALQPRPAQATRRMVYVVYLAAPPNDVTEEDRQQRHQERGESDWQPFGAQQHVDEFMDSVRDCKVEKWPFNYFNAQMAHCLKEAGDKQPVLFVVDPWSASKLDGYRQALKQYRELSKQHGTFACPLVIWNEEDEKSAVLRAEFEERVETIFGRDRWEPVNDPKEFRDRLAYVVSSLRNKIRMARTISRPPNGSPLPRISPT